MIPKSTKEANHMKIAKPYNETFHRIECQKMRLSVSEECKGCMPVPTYWNIIPPFSDIKYNKIGYYKRYVNGYGYAIDPITDEKIDWAVHGLGL